MIQTEEILEKLNEEQIKPVLETEGAVLVLAGAGSGKTRVLTSRIAYLVQEKRVPASAVLAITFTNKAANEMKERLSRFIDVSNTWVCTIHSMCVRILRMYAKEMGFEDNFSIYSETERNNIIKKSFQECDYDDEKLLKLVKFHIANAKMLGFEPQRYSEEYAGERDIEDIVNAVMRENAQLLGLSALMTTTVSAMEQTITEVKKQCPNCKIMVGGAVLTQEYANKINADFYASDANIAVKIAKEVFD